MEAMMKTIIRDYIKKKSALGGCVLTSKSFEEMSVYGRAVGVDHTAESYSRVHRMMIQAGELEPTVDRRHYNGSKKKIRVWEY